MGGHLSHLEVVKNTEIFGASCGPVRGNIYQHEHGKIVDGYLGIPYAKPVKRFEKAEEAEVWTTIRDCHEYGPKAPQARMGKSVEDPQANTDEYSCLTLNVFVPHWKSEHGLRPVMVFIHGGGFEMGSSADYCHISMSGSLPLKDVILVSINYRLGVLGFLTTGDHDCKGNFGLWDQILALKWVQRHIRSFGGDPDNVTVFGQSAGGASVDFLALSPQSRDLFHKMIPMSGSAFCSWAMRTKENQIRVFEEFAEHLGYNENEQKSILEFYKSISPRELGKLEGFKKSRSGGHTFIPNFDGDFFPKPLDELRKEAGKKSIMTGVCEYEGMLLALFDPRMSTGAEDVLKEQIDNNMKEDILENSKEIQNMVFKKYSEGIDGADSDAMRKKAIEFVGDYMFDLGVLLSARNAAKHGNDVYLYSFEYCNPEGFGMFQKMVPFPASTHATDIRYILGEGVINKFEPSETDLEMFETMTTLYANFARTGNPGWEKLGSQKNAQRHYRIAYPKSEMRDVFHDGRWEFFEKIVENDKGLNKFVYGVDLRI